jgi:hypothetical protein
MSFDFKALLQPPGDMVKEFEVEQANLRKCRASIEAMLMKHGVNIPKFVREFRKLLSEGLDEAAAFKKAAMKAGFK